MAGALSALTVRQKVVCANRTDAGAAVFLTIMLMSIAFAGWKPGVPQSGSSLSKLTRTDPGGMLALRLVRMVMQRWSSQSCRMLFIM
jgi:hypothetical protein